MKDIKELLQERGCCECGTYHCTIPIPIQGRVQHIDFCIADVVSALNAANITTIASCCGHKNGCGDIILEDGRQLFIVQNPEAENFMMDILKAMGATLRKKIDKTLRELNAAELEQGGK